MLKTYIEKFIVTIIDIMGYEQLLQKFIIGGIKKCNMEEYKLN